MKTEFQDRGGKPLHTGDIIMWRLGKFAKKSSGPTYFRVTRTKRGIMLTNPQLGPEGRGGFLLRKNQEEYVTLYDQQYRESE
jgi:hypothetical protein